MIKFTGEADFEKTGSIKMIVPWMLIKIVECPNQINLILLVEAKNWLISGGLISGKSFSGYITGVKEFGLFVDIPELFTSGLLHVNDLPNDFYRYNARHQSLDGRRRGNKFSLGDRIDVFIGDIKELEGKISLYY